MNQFFPFIEWIKKTTGSSLRGDIIGGLTVGVLLIPQGMAYAMIAGLPPEYGLYTALVPPVIYMFFGTSRLLSVGPVALDSLMVAGAIIGIKLTEPLGYVATAVLLALMIGAVQAILGIL
ncbi:MAG: sodium-independent anion transporter, partial [Flavobacteriales bacterium]|nr:sodium-independent anion transporter [Flavobacteriales bacterium]